VVLHAITNAVSGITGVNILGKIADELCLKEGITDSRVFLKKALSYMKNYKICHVSISIEALRPKLSDYIDPMCESIAGILGIEKRNVGITATTGEGLTEFGKGNGIYCTVILTVKEYGSHEIINL
jgi:2-C-methyl-D-erythritol 2,4-cyclodiphosphate synthase